MPDVSKYAQYTLTATYWFHRAYDDLPLWTDYDHLTPARKLFANRGAWYDELALREQRQPQDMDVYTDYYHRWQRGGKTTASMLGLLAKLGGA